MLQELFEDDDFHQVSSARRIVNISETVRANYLIYLQGEIYGSSCLNERVYSSYHYYGGRNLISEPWTTKSPTAAATALYYCCITICHFDFRTL
jgi:hypothetical protein